MRLLPPARRGRRILVIEVAAGIAELIGGQPGADAVERVDENLARIVVLDLVIFQFEGRHAAADSYFQPSVAEMIEDTNLLDQAQRRVEREQVDQRAE